MSNINKKTVTVKGDIVKARINQETKKKLEYCVYKTKFSKSEIIRIGINKIFEEIKENE